MGDTLMINYFLSLKESDKHKEITSTKKVVDKQNEM
jgi:hypothetical protein